MIKIHTGSLVIGVSNEGREWACIHSVHKLQEAGTLWDLKEDTGIPVYLEGNEQNLTHDLFGNSFTAYRIQKVIQALRKDVKISAFRLWALTYLEAVAKDQPTAICVLEHV